MHWAGDGAAKQSAHHHVAAVSAIIVCVSHHQLARDARAAAVEELMHLICCACVAHVCTTCNDDPSCERRGCNNVCAIASHIVCVHTMMLATTHHTMCVRDELRCVRRDVRARGAARND